MSRTSKPSDRAARAGAVAVLGASLAGCVSPPRASVASREDTERRRPDAVVIDPELVPPPARETAGVDEGLVTLRTPLAPSEARAVVRGFLEAVAREDLDGVRRVLGASAQWLRPGSPRGEEALSAWSRRFTRLDYFPLVGSVYWIDDGIEVARMRDALTDVDRFGLAPDVRRDAADVVARAEIPSARAGVPLFGEAITFVLRRSEQGYVIEQLVEDFTPP
jgi:hypothetical protein